MTDQSVTAQLPNGALVRVTIPPGRRLVAEDVGATGQIFDTETVREAIEGVAELVTGALSRVKPDKTSVELNLGFDVEAGKLVALFASGHMDASLKITLEWGTK
jgi:hypothetical protein